jgi:hypothetical protein|uniref:Uncharacterized protein n=1 Tax=Panagrolaimus sp. PS1159 TaxID=55785 RepID=A0AC35FPF6_9BILA
MPVAYHESVVNDKVLNEIETVSIAKTHTKVIEELENDPKKFKNFKAIIFAEYNVRVLAEDYMNKFQKNLINKNEQIKAVAMRFAKREIYDIIQDFKNHPNKLQNEHLLEMFIKTISDCVESAFILATHRKQTRENANFEQLLDGQAVMKQQLHLLVENMRLQPTHQPIPAQAPVNLEQNNIQPNVTPIFNVAPLPPPPVPQNVQPNPNEPFWLISREECNILYNSNLTVDSFTRAYLLKIFTTAELILPSKEIRPEKKNEFLKVAPLFFHNEEQQPNWNEKFEKTLKNLRFQKRQKIFKNLDERTGFGITALGVEFYYQRPLCNQTQCFSTKGCSVGSRINTIACGNIRIAEKCGIFEYLLLIEKTSRLCSIHKLLPNGTLVKIPS